MILRCIPCLDMFPTKTMEVTRKHIRHAVVLSATEWKEAAGLAGSPDNVLGRSSLQENVNLQNLCFFENSIMGMWDCILCLPSWFPREHFEALDFKIMFLANSVHLGFWNISWTYSPRPRNYSYGKLLLYVEQEPFVLSDAIDTSNVTSAIPCEAPGLRCSSVSSQHGPSHSLDIWQALPFYFVKCNFKLFIFFLLLYENV